MEKIVEVKYERPVHSETYEPIVRLTNLDNNKAFEYSLVEATEASNGNLDAAMKIYRGVIGVITGN